MNSVAARLRAMGVTLLAFALAGMALAALVVGLGRFPALTGLLPGTLPDPANWIGLLLAPRYPALLTSLFLLVAAAVTLLRSAYLDRMLEIFGDVLLMILAAALGATSGIWALLRLLRGGPALTMAQALPLGILAALVFAVLLIAPHRVRRNALIRVIAALIFMLAAPTLLAWAWGL